MILTVKEMQKKVRTCKLCEHDYLRPCNGKDKTCMNGMWVHSGKDMKVYNKMREDLGLQAPKPEKKSKRVRLVIDKPKSKRVRL